MKKTKPTKFKLRGPIIIEAGDWLAAHMASGNYDARLVRLMGAKVPLARDTPTRSQCEFIIALGDVVTALEISFGRKSDAVLFKLTWGGSR